MGNGKKKKILSIYAAEAVSWSKWEQGGDRRGRIFVLIPEFPKNCQQVVPELDYPHRNMQGLDPVVQEREKIAEADRSEADHRLC
ncbi:hypothetical protein TNCV_3730211 [Trichonephila clavipes]|nr:hypothetical protein TNCV_3730211 [Trichonephila clavipes]